MIRGGRTIIKIIAFSRRLRPEKVTFLRLQVGMVEISRVEVYERVGKSNISNRSNSCLYLVMLNVFP